MNIHFFYSRKYNGSWYALVLEAIMEEDAYCNNSNYLQKSFTYIEEIHAMINTDLRSFHCANFRIEFGKNQCRGAASKSVKHLYDSKLKDKYENFIPITQKQYERLRKFIFLIYEREKCMDFSLVEAKQTSQFRIL